MVTCNMSMFTIHEKINYTIYKVFNICSDIYFFISKDLNTILKNNVRFNHLHDNNRCFIIGTGPSINNIDNRYIDTLKSEIVFGVNSFYKSEKLIDIVPKYYVLMDNNYWNKYSYTFNDIKYFYKDNCPTFITDIRARSIIKDIPESIFIYAKNYPINYSRYSLGKNISAVMNVVGFSILSAMFMGFSEIYLLGCDYNLFCSLKHNHCYPDGDHYSPSNTLSFYLKYYHITTEAHYAISRTARRDGFKIVNLTEGSLLDAYERDDISNILSVPPSGKEGI